MSQRFIKFIDNEKSRWLQEKHPWAFLLLVTIARRARRTPDSPDGYEIGECHIGDYKISGIPTEKIYRGAKDVLIREGIILICETCRKRKKRATKGATGSTTYGTKVKLLCSDICDINLEETKQRKGDRKGDRRATEGRPTHSETEIPCPPSFSPPPSLTLSSPPSISPPQTLRKKKNEEEVNSEPAQAPPQAGAISFNPSYPRFEGITEAQAETWAIAYPSISIQQELAKAASWAKENPSKSKKNWGRFLISWLGRSEERTYTAKAYRESGDRKPARNTLNNQVVTEYDNLW
jgi:hypothetical protein